MGLSLGPECSNNISQPRIITVVSPSVVSTLPFRLYRPLASTKAVLVRYDFSRDAKLELRPLYSKNNPFE